MFLASVAELGIEAHTWGSYIICLISCCCCHISLNLTQRCRQKYNLTSPQCPLEVVCACVCVWKFKCVWRCLCAQAANLCMLAFACLMCVHALKWAQLCVCVRCSLKVPLIVMFKASAVQLVSLYGIFRPPPSLSVDWDYRRGSPLGAIGWCTGDIWSVTFPPT